MIWCIILVKMKYNANKEQLNGFYTSETPNCSSGEIVLLKANKNFNASETEVVRNSTLDDIVYSLIDEEAVTGRQFILEDVRFQSAKYSITSNSYTYLNKLVKILKENKTIKIHLKGHTDSDGRDDANFILSQKRAKSVAHYFIKQGIKKDRISYEGYGESRPIRFGNASKDKQKNRRVELLIISQ